MTAARRFQLWKVAIAAWVAVWALWLVLLRGDGVLTQTAMLVIGWAVIGAIGLGVAWLLKTTPRDAIVLKRANSERMILGLCASAVVGTWLMVQPGLSTDHYRYIVEGRMWLAGVSPYRNSPEQFLGVAAAEQGGVNHPSLPSIYPPVAQAIFTATSAVASVVGGEHAVAVFRVFAGVAAISGAVLLLLLLRADNRSAWWAAPVVLSAPWVMETAGTPHVDVFGVCLLLGSLLSWRGGRGFVAGLLLALACGVKPQVAVVFPFLARSSPLPTTLGFLLAAAPQLGVISYQGGWPGFLATSRLYATSWEANGSLFEFLKSLAVFGDDPRVINRLKDVGRMIGPVSLVLGGWLLWRYRAGPVAAAYVLQGLLLLTSPVVYPWYLLWVLPLAVLVPVGGTAALVAGSTLGISYLLGRLGQGWTLPGWALWLEWGPVYAALLGTLITHLRSPSPATPDMENLRNVPQRPAAPIASTSV